MPIMCDINDDDNELWAPKAHSYLWALVQADRQMLLSDTSAVLLPTSLLEEIEEFIGYDEMGG